MKQVRPGKQKQQRGGRASNAHGNGLGAAPARVYSTQPLFLRVHQSGTSCGIYLPVPLRIALGVRAGDALRATLEITEGDGGKKQLILERAD